MYPPEPADKRAFIHQYDRYYRRFARVYDFIVKCLPIWRNWIKQAIPYIEGPKVLEVSFGTGYLLTQYAGQFHSFGIDYNLALARVAKQNLNKKGVRVDIQQADIYHLPYPPGCFDSVVNTMAFSGYPDGLTALKEIYRVLKPGGRFVLLDVDYPEDNNRLGMLSARLWKQAGDILRDMGPLFNQVGFTYETKCVGGFGSVKLFVAVKKEISRSER